MYHAIVTAGGKTETMKGSTMNALIGGPAGALHIRLYEKDGVTHFDITHVDTPSGEKVQPILSGSFEAWIPAT